MVDDTWNGILYLPNCWGSEKMLMQGVVGGPVSGEVSRRSPDKPRPVSLEQRRTMFAP
jgi:hypothetical protein